MAQRSQRGILDEIERVSNDIQNIAACEYARNRLYVTPDDLWSMFSEQQRVFVVTAPQGSVIRVPEIPNPPRYR